MAQLLRFTIYNLRLLSDINLPAGPIWMSATRRSAGKGWGLESIQILTPEPSRLDLETLNPQERCRVHFLNMFSICALTLGELVAR